MTHRLLSTFPGQVVGLVQSDVIIPGKNTLQAFWFLLWKTGLGFVFLKGTEIILSKIANFFMQMTGKQSQIPALSQMSSDYDLPLLGAKNVNAPAIRQQIQAWQPDLIVSVYLNQRIGKKIIDMPTTGVINVHPALLPKNRGLFPYFWAMAQGDTESGVTVHWVEPQFDTGAILIQKSLPISPQDT
ncbi:MAG: formyltransferase family protein, partial [Chloroflexota bacterium]